MIRRATSCRLRARWDNTVRPAATVSPCGSLYGITQPTSSATCRTTHGSPTNTAYWQRSSQSRRQPTARSSLPIGRIGRTPARRPWRILGYRSRTCRVASPPTRSVACNLLPVPLSSSMGRPAVRHLVTFTRTAQFRDSPHWSHSRRWPTCSQGALGLGP